MIDMSQQKNQSNYAYVRVVAAAVPASMFLLATHQEPEQ